MNEQSNTPQEAPKANDAPTVPAATQPIAKKPVFSAATVILITVASIIFLIAGFFTVTAFCNDDLSCVGSNIFWIIVAIPIAIFILYVIASRRQK